MDAWDIRPLDGIGPVRFGMTVAELEAALGATHAAPKPNEARFADQGARVSLTGGKVSEISVWPTDGADIVYAGESVFRGDPETVLRAVETEEDGPVFEDVGFLMFPKLGLMATGLHDGDTAQLPVTVLPEPMEADFYDDGEEVTFLD